MSAHRMTEKSRKTILKAAKEILPYLNSSDAFYFLTGLHWRNNRFFIESPHIYDDFEELTENEGQEELGTASIDYYWL